MEYQYQISDEEDDEVMMNAPQIHGAPPVYDETPVIPGTNLPIQAESTDHSTVMRNEEEAMIAGPGKIEMDYDMGPVDDATNFMEEAHVAEPTAQMIGPLMTGLEEDPHSPKTLPAKVTPSNYQAKLTDPTGEGGKEVDVDPILERLDNFHIHNKDSQPHDDQQVAPQSTPCVNQAQPEPEPEPMPRDTKTSTIAGKISSATSAIAGKAVSAKDTVASKLGYGGGDKKPVTEVAKEKLAPAYEKVAGAGSAAAERGRDGGVSVKEYLSEKLRPGEEDKALSEAIKGRFYNKKGEEVAAAESGGGGGGGVVDRLKGAVGSWPWVGKSKGIGLSDGSVVVVEEEIDCDVKLQQESGNH